jgi:hypothetical protein
MMVIQKVEIPLYMRTLDGEYVQVAIIEREIVVTVDGYRG